MYVTNKVGISQSYYCQVELGERQMKLDLALKICDVLEIDFTDFQKTVCGKRPAVVQKKRRIQNSLPY